MYARFVDFQKVFDTVVHSEIKIKLVYEQTFLNYQKYIFIEQILCQTRT